MSLNKFSRGIQEREGISILCNPGAQSVGEKHSGETVQVLPILESLGARED